MTGKIPQDLGDLSNLEWLDISGNYLSGEIPPELGNLHRLKELYLRDNDFSGCIPEGLRNVQSNNFAAAGLEFCSESLTATLEETISEREALVALYEATGGANWVENNNWMSDAPLGEWHGVTTDDRGRVITLSLQENELTGEIPPELGDLSNLESLRLRDNRLSGEIPAELGGLSTLRELNLAWNKLTGVIPEELGNLSSLSLQGPRLDGNELSGQIPPELGNLSNLSWLYLESNEFKWADTEGVGRPVYPCKGTTA